MLGPFVTARITVDRAEQIEHLQAERRVITNLCRALEAYLCREIDHTLQHIANAKDETEHYTDEMLIEAREKIESAAARLEALKAALADADMPDAQRQLLTAFGLPMVEKELREATEWAECVQQGLEARQAKDKTE